MKILVVDDRPDNTELVCQILEDEYETIRAHSGAECLKSAVKEHPDIILLDLLMPEMDGYEVLRRLQADRRTSKILVILLTARFKTTDRIVSGLDLGAFDYVMKPVDDSVLLARVRTAARVKQADLKTEYFSRILEDSLSEIYFFDGASLLYTRINRGARRNLGYSSEEFSLLSAIDIMAEFTRESFEDLIKPLRSGEEEIIVFDAVHRRKNGSLYPVEVHLQLETDETPIFVAFILDISKRVEAEASLKSERNRYRSLISSAPICIHEIDLDGNLISMNESGLAMMGVENESEIRGLAYVDIPVADDREMTSELLEKALKGEGSTFEFRVNGENGESFYRSCFEPIFDESGSVMKLMGVTQDLTEEKHAADEKRKLELKVARAQKMELIGQLAGGIAHDFNNMLGVIVGQSEVVLNQLTPEDRHFAAIEEILKASKRSSNLTRRLLTFASEQPIFPQNVDLNTAVVEMLEILRRLIGEDINLTWNPGEGVIRALLDPTQIDQILTNLVVNAKDAIDGAGNITLETGLVTMVEDSITSDYHVAAGKFAFIRVLDDGRGIDESTKEHIFEPFFSTKEAYQAAGLGLSIVFGIVKQNSGFITVESKPGGGTSFQINFPASEGEIIHHTERISVNSPLSVSETVLLVEDEEALLNVCITILEERGYSVLAATNPREAVSLVEKYEHDIHILLTDVILPEMNGADLAKKIKSLKPNMKSVFMSGYTADIISENDVMGAGSAFIQKPFQADLLLSTLREVLND